MNFDIKDEKLIKHYLLGMLPPEQFQKIEEHLLVNDQYFQQILAIEDELIEEYLSSKLSKEEQKTFEEHFMSVPEHRKSVQNAALLRNFFFDELASIATPHKRKRISLLSSIKEKLSLKNIVPLPMAAVVTTVILLIVSAVTWKAIQRSKSGEQIVQESSSNRIDNREDKVIKEIEQTNKSIQPTESTLQPPTNVEKAQPNKNSNHRERSAPLIASLELISGQTMGAAESNEVRLKPEIESLQLKLLMRMDDSYRNYQAEVLSDEEKQVWNQRRVKILEKDSYNIAIMTLPANRLRAGSYRVILNGQTDNRSLEKIGTYYFKVTR
jgi:hypothetical protein